LHIDTIKKTAKKFEAIFTGKTVIYNNDLNFLNNDFIGGKRISRKPNKAPTIATINIEKIYINITFILSTTNLTL